MMYDEEVPKEVRGLPREERLSWYERRVEKYLPGYMFLESLDHGLTEEELEESLCEIRDEIEEVKSLILYKEDVEFRGVCEKLKNHISEIGVLNSQKVKLLLGGKSQVQLIALQDEVTRIVKLARACEETIKIVCLAKDVNPNYFLRLNRIGIR